MSADRREVAVVHLVRKGNPVGLLRDFVESYKRHPAGMEHRLVFAFKGYLGEPLPPEVEEIAAAAGGERLFFNDAGFDLTVYRLAAEKLEGARYLLFFNSYSVILADGWLEKMYGWIRRPEVGVAGATAAAFSHSSSYWEGSIKKAAMGKQSVFMLPFRFLRFFLYLKRFPLFPNHFVRTNAFIIRREDWLSLRFGPLRTKTDAYIVEGGRRGLAAHLARKGKKMCMVGADGRGYFPEEWSRAPVFFVAGQENLMVRDNMTEMYRRAAPESRKWQNRSMWSRTRILGVVVPSWAEDWARRQGRKLRGDQAGPSEGRK